MDECLLIPGTSGNEVDWVSMHYSTSGLNSGSGDELVMCANESVWVMGQM